MTVVAADRLVQVWVDRLGCVHEIEPGNGTRTLCGLDAGEVRPDLIPRVCRDCIRTHRTRFDVGEGPR